MERDKERGREGCVVRKNPTSLLRYQVSPFVVMPNLPNLSTHTMERHIFLSVIHDMIPSPPSFVLLAGWRRWLFSTRFLLREETDTLCPLRFGKFLLHRENEWRGTIWSSIFNFSSRLHIFTLFILLSLHYLLHESCEFNARYRFPSRATEQREKRVWINLSSRYCLLSVLLKCSFVFVKRYEEMMGERNSLFLCVAVKETREIEIKGKNYQIPSEDSFLRFHDLPFLRLLILFPFLLERHLSFSLHHQLHLWFQNEWS